MKVSITILFLLGMSFLGHSQYTHWNNVYDTEDETAFFFPQKLFVRDFVFHISQNKTSSWMPIDSF